MRQKENVRHYIISITQMRITFPLLISNSFIVCMCSIVKKKMWYARQASYSETKLSFKCHINDYIWYFNALKVQCSVERSDESNQMKKQSDEEEEEAEEEEEETLPQRKGIPFRSILFLFHLTFPAATKKKKKDEEIM